MYKMREEFEAWFLIVSGVDVFSDRDGRAYKCEDDESTRYLCGIWLSWKASRVALCVELPTKINDDNDAHSYGYDSAITDVEMALELSGVSYI